MIVPWRRLYIDLMIRVMDDEPRSDIMCYLLHRAVDRGSFNLTFCCKEYQQQIDDRMLDGPWPRPAQVMERWLLSSVFFANCDEFNFQALNYPGEPPSRFFGQLLSAFRFTDQIQHMERYYASGLDSLINKVPLENFADALFQVANPEDVANHLQGYVAKLIHLHLDRIIEGGVGICLDIREARIVINICARFQKAFDMAEP